MIKLDMSKPIFGCFVNVSSAGLIEMVAASGFDFIVLDMEHGCFNWKDLEDDIRACEVVNTPCVVRIPECRREYILRALDSGASGIQVPMVQTKAMAEEIVSLAKYPPLGKRGASFSHRAAKYGRAGNKADYLRNANADTRIIIHIENPESVEQLDDILSVDGIDVIFIGPTDLAVSMGHAAEPAHSEVRQMIRHVKNSILAKHKPAGILGGTLEELMAYKSEDFAYLTTTFQAVFNPAANQWVERFHCDRQGEKS